MMGKKKIMAAINELRFEVQLLAEAVYEMRNVALAMNAASEAEQQQHQQQQPELPETQPFDLNIEVTDQELADVAALMLALGQPTRLRIAMSLAEQPRSVSDLVGLLELNTTGSAYHHLNVLTQAGIVEQPVRGEFALREKTRPQINRLMSSLFGRGQVVRDTPTPEQLAEIPDMTADDDPEASIEIVAKKKKRKKSKARMKEHALSDV